MQADEASAEDRGQKEGRVDIWFQDDTGHFTDRGIYTEQGQVRTGCRSIRQSGGISGVRNTKKQSHVQDEVKEQEEGRVDIWYQM